MIIIASNGFLDAIFRNRMEMTLLDSVHDAYLLRFREEIASLESKNGIHYTLCCSLSMLNMENVFTSMIDCRSLKRR